MKVEIRENEIELVPETEHERDAIAKLLYHGVIKVELGRTSDNNWPPDYHKCNAVLVIKDDKW